MTVRSLLLAFVMLIAGTDCSALGPREHGWVSFDVSPDGRSVAFTAADGVSGVYVLDLQARTVRQLTAMPGVTTSPAFSPDGKHVVFAAAPNRDGPFHLFVYSFATRSVSQITNDPAASDRDPSYSSDGSTIVFARAYRQRPYSMGGLTWNDWDVATIGQDGSKFRRRTVGKYYRLTSPRFAANDMQVIYSAMGKTPILFRVNPDSAQSPSPFSPPILNKGCGSQGSDVQLSRDEHDLTFIADGEECFAYDVYVGDQSAVDAKPLGVTSVSRYNQHPVFVPGTRQVMYLAGTQEAGGGRSRFSLYSVARDGSYPHEVAGPNLFDDPLHWRSN